MARTSIMSHTRAELACIPKISGEKLNIEIHTKARVNNVNKQICGNLVNIFHYTILNQTSHNIKNINKSNLWRVIKENVYIGKLLWYKGNKTLCYKINQLQGKNKYASHHNTVPLIIIILFFFYINSTPCYVLFLNYKSLWMCVYYQQLNKTWM